jgi:hypothetical protein
MSEVTGCGILKVFLTNNVKEIFWDLKFLSEVTGCRKTQVLDCTGSTVCTNKQISLFGDLNSPGNHILEVLEYTRINGFI